MAVSARRAARGFLLTEPTPVARCSANEGQAFLDSSQTCSCPRGTTRNPLVNHPRPSLPRSATHLQDRALRSRLELRRRIPWGIEAAGLVWGCPFVGENPTATLQTILQQLHGSADCFPFTDLLSLVKRAEILTSSPGPQCRNCSTHPISCRREFLEVVHRGKVGLTIPVNPAFRRSRGMTQFMTLPAVSNKSRADAPKVKRNLVLWFTKRITL